MKQGWLCCHRMNIHSPVAFLSPYKVGALFSGVPGRPSYAISREHLLFSLDHCFTIPEIAVLLGICRKRRPRKTKTHWSKTKTIWSKTKTHQSKMKTLWSKTKTHWSKMKTHWSKTKTLWSTKRPTGLKPFCLQGETILAKLLSLL